METIKNTWNSITNSLQKLTGPEHQSAEVVLHGTQQGGKHKKKSHKKKSHKKKSHKKKTHKKKSHKYKTRRTKK